MAYYYGPVMDETYGVRPYLDVTVSQSDTAWTFVIKFGVQPTKLTIPSGRTAKGKLTGNVEWKTYSKTTTASIAKNAYFQVGTLTITRERYASSSRSFQVDWDGTLTGGTATGTAAIATPASYSTSIDPLAHYYIQYNKNATDSSISSMPSNQTKIHGTALTLSSTKPTRTNYTFISWNTQSNGSGSSYNPGSSYTANATATLYAIWQRNYEPPQIKNLTAYRVDTNDPPQIDSEGVRANVEFIWTSGIDGSGVVTLSQVEIKWKRAIDSTYLSGNSVIINNPSNTVSAVIGVNNSTLSTEFQYDIQVILTPTRNHPTITRMTYVSVASFIMDVNTEGNAIGIGMVAPDDITGNSQLHIGSDTYFYNPIYIKNITTIYATKTTASSTQNKYTYANISDLAKYNIIAIRAEVRNIRQILYFIRPFDNIPQMIMDMSGTTYIRGQFIVDWANNRIGVRWVNGTSDFATNIFFQQVYGIG